MNPVAGMGGPVGLKGTDDVVERAIALGARPTAGGRASEMLHELARLIAITGDHSPIDWLTCSGPMGADLLAAAGFGRASILHVPGRPTSADDTIRAVRAMVAAGAELIVFCGGDGTARDVCGETGGRIPVLGIPAGVKMYSGVFGVTPLRSAQLLVGYLTGELGLAEVEVLDIDEERFRRGDWAVRLHAIALTPYEPSFTQAAKALITGVGEREAAEAVADEIVERIEAAPGTLAVLGPGSTVATVKRRLGMDATLLGVDAMVDGRAVGVDVNEQDLRRLVARHPRRLLILSPIGAQGFVLGRGNQQLSADVVRRIGPPNVVVIATPAKLGRTPSLRFDTGDRELDQAFAAGGYLPVVTGYHRSRLVPVVI
ncbi:MAG: ATP-NAD kinase family protein [Acidimicrobiia bacterium]|nr:ATP-NAD kinase family protein [Acidimicrobiia bacterium]MDH5291575.1 ATP-NAD kinase family protein [Acidimicrobiia bacterium]